MAGIDNLGQKFMEVLSGQYDWRSGLCDLSLLAYAGSGACSSRSYPVETIRCDHFERWNLELDGTGFYVVIKPDFSDGLINMIIKQDIEYKPIIEFVGLQAQNIYHEIFAYEKQNGLQWFQEKTHIAYLGKELKKAEIAVLGSTYYQE